jgi:hypothetical protein
MSHPAVALTPLALAHFLFKGAPLLVLIGAFFAALTGAFGVNFIKPTGRGARLCVALLMTMGICLGIAGWIQAATNLQDADLQARIATQDHNNSQNSIDALQSKLDKLIAPPPNEVALCLVDKARPALVLVNTTDRVAEKVLYSFGLFDLDSDTPDIPLRVLGGTAEFIKPKLWVGPMDFFSSIVAGGPSTKDGDRIVGSIAASCPKCAPAHTYLISITLGKGGWYSLYKPTGPGEGVVAPITRDPSKPFFDARNFSVLLAAVPQNERMQIEDSRTYITRGRTVGDCPTGLGSPR